jgi:MOSC domain-containing protein YiiM
MSGGEELTIVSVNVSKPKVLLHWPDGDVISSIDKEPVEVEALELSNVNLEGDEQADTRPTPGGGQVHGGPHAAVYAVPGEHYARISELIGRPARPGFMGENLTIAGMVEADACIGDVWRWGQARLEISAPRGPCYKLGIRMGKQPLRTAIRDETLVGWYLRVLTPGRVPTRGVITIESRHPAQVSVAQVQHAINDRATTYPGIAGLAPLTPSVARILTVRDRDIFGGVPESD